MGFFEELDLQVENDEKQEAAETSRRERVATVSAAIASPIRRFFRAILKVVFYPLISPMGYSKRFNVEGDVVVMKRSWTWRIIDGLLTRLLLTPLLVAAFLCIIVYANTHPKRVSASSSPEGLGMYYKALTLDTVDGTRVAAWYIPAVTADEVAFDPDEALRRRRPAAVLVHGLGASHDQLLPLAKHLHDAGFVVLMLDLRGQGDSPAATVTYGLRERTDVLAATKFLRELSQVDETKVVAVGRDIGAVACLEAAALDPSLQAVVADGLWPSFDARARQIFTSPIKALPTQWLAPLYTTSFEIALRERWSSWDLDTVMRSIHRQPVFFIARPGEEFAPVGQLVQLAASAGSRHDLFLADGAHVSQTDDRITSFLMQVTNWDTTKARGVNEIKSLLEHQVK